MEILSGQTPRHSLAPEAPEPVSALKKRIFLIHSTPRPTHPVRAALEQKGYEVISADSVDAALRMWVKFTKPVDLFLADIMLGKDPITEQLVKLLQAENPRMRVLYANDLDLAAPLVMQRYPQQLIAVVDNCLA
jgi:hypothetical protein